MQDDMRFDRARSRAVAKYGFYGHAAVYLAVNLLLLIVNLVNWQGYLWSIWPLLGWGIALALHASKVYRARTRDRIVDHLTDEELRRDRLG